MNFMTHSLLLTLSLALSASAAPRPNIVFCIADDWGWPHAGSYGDAVVKTPIFDGLAQSGVLFEQAYVSAPSCTPSRNAVLTGKFHWSLREGANLWSSFPKGEQTYPRILEENGYFVGSYRKSFGPGRDSPKPAAGDRYKSPKQFFEQRPKGKPFCFWFGSSDPHRGYVKGSGVKSGMRQENVQVPPVLPDVAEVRSDICDYYFEVQRFDREVGNLIDLLKKSGELDNTIIIMTGDHGWPFPRGKSNLYDLGTRVPLAISWGENIVSPARTSSQFVSLTDIAPTVLELAGLPTNKGMHGKSLVPILKNQPAQANRDYVITGKERHTPCQEIGEQSAPCRAIRTEQFLYIHNFQPDRWPAGAAKSEIRGNYGDIDNGPTKSFIIDHKNESTYKRFFDLSCGKRPQEELYDNLKDPFQTNNLADNPEYQSVLKKLKHQLFTRLKETDDLQMLGKGETYEQWPYLGNKKRTK